MRKRLKKRRSLRLTLYALTTFAAIVFGAVWWFHRWDRAPLASIKPLPTPYSDTHITKNAQISDPRFRDTLAISGGSSVAGILSAFHFHKSQVLPEDLSSEKGTWLWTPVLEITPSYRDAIISGAKINGISTIYLSIDSYLDIFSMIDGAEKSALKKKFDDTLEDFVAHAHKAGISVDAEGGWRNWAEPGHTYKALAVVHYAIEFNKAHAEKLRGFQYDVEPYLLDLYQSDRTLVLRRFTALVDSTLDWLYGSDLRFSVVVPDFYDTKLGSPYIYGFHYEDAVQHLVRLLDRRTESSIIVMAYRNLAAGVDGVIDISENEVRDAKGHETKVVIASEFGDVPPPYITFYNTSRHRYDKQIAAVEKAFTSDPGFGGISLHYINAFLALK